MEEPGGRQLTDREARILEHFPQVKAIVNRIVVRLPSHIEVNDLISAGVLGLIDAIEKYDSSREIKFNTYAEFRIRGAILDELRSQDWAPRTLRRNSKLSDDTRNRLEQESGREVTDEEGQEI